MNFKRTLVALLAAYLSAGCGGRTPKLPCPLGIDPTVVELSDCEVIPQKAFVYCDEPEVVDSSPGVVQQVKDPVCRKEFGSEEYSATEAAPIMIGPFFARGPEICDPEGARNIELSMQQLKADYYYNIDQRNIDRVSRSLGGQGANLRFLKEKHYEYGAIQSRDAPSLFPPIEGESILNKTVLGVLRLADASDGDIVLLGDMSYIKKVYTNGTGDFLKLLAPRHYFCTPGPILGRRIGTAAEDVSKRISFLFGESANPGAARLGELSRYQHIDNAVGVDPGVATLLGILGSGGAIASSAGGTGLAGIIRGLIEDNRVELNPLAKTGAAVAQAAAAKASFGDDSSGVHTSGAGGGGAGGSSGSMSGSAPGAAPLAASSAGGSGSSSGGGGSSGGAGTGSDGLTAASDGKGGGLAEGSSKLDYSTASAGGGGKKSGGPMDFMAGLLGGKGGSGGDAGTAGAGSVSFGKGGAPGPSGAEATMSDAQLEDYLKSNGRNSLFEIANRRYFKWGTGVMGAQAVEQLRK